MFIFASLGYQEECVLTILSSWLSCCQEVKFIFSIISGQIAHTEENDIWGQMLKTQVSRSLSWKSKEQE